jgi:hypothetical protein
MNARQLEGTAQYPTRWEVESFTNPNKRYVTSQKVDATWACSCNRWIFSPKPKKDCKHILAIKAEEPVDVVRTEAYRRQQQQQQAVVAQAKATERERSRVSGVIASRTAKPEPVMVLEQVQPIFLQQTRRTIKFRD